MFVEPVVDFLRKLAKEIQLEFQVFHPVSIAKPTVVLSWIGRDPASKSILLNSHTDVVPVFEEFWTHKPFAADIDEEGKIFARGSQDMKCVGMQYLGAIRALKNTGISLKRTIHTVFVPDEEIFGEEGMKAFVLSDGFRSLNVGFTLDEGIASPTDFYDVFYGERTCWRKLDNLIRLLNLMIYFLDVVYEVIGQPGHGSLLLTNTAAEKLKILLDKIYDYRKSQEDILDANPQLFLGDVTTVNVTKISGGKQRNVLPPCLEVTVDVRIAVTEDSVKFEEMLRKWGKEAGDNIQMKFLIKEPQCPPTPTDDSNIYWKAFKQAIDGMNMKTKLQVFPAGTDASYIRAVGIPAIGFSPMINTPILLHDHDEYLQADVYLKGIEIYKTILQSVANA